MSIKLIKHSSKLKLTRGDDNTTEYSTGGKNGEEIEIPQIDESLSGQDFWQAFVNVVTDEEEAKKIINKQVFADGAVREARTKYKSTWKKTGVMDNSEATKLAIQAARDFTPVLAKERGTVVTEAFAAKNQMDVLKAARAKFASGDMTHEDYFELLEKTLNES